MRYPTAVLALFILFPASILFAQEPVSIRFRAVSWTAGKPEGFSYLQKGKPVVLDDLGPSVRSKMLDYSGPSPLVLYPPDAAIVPSGDAKPPAPLAVIPIPSGIRHPLIILVPNPEKDGPPYKGMVFDDDPSVFPYPSYSFVNLSGKNVAISFGEEQFGLAPGKRKLLTSQAKTINLRLAVPKEGREGWSVIYDNFYPNWPEERTLMFIVDVKRKDRLYTEPRVLLENKAVWENAVSRKKEEEP